MLSGEKEYFGMLQEVVELEDDSKHKVVLFKCDWFDIHTDNIGIKRRIWHYFSQCETFSENE